MSSEGRKNNIPNEQFTDSIEIKQENEIKTEPMDDVENVKIETSADQIIKTEFEHSDEDEDGSVYCSLDLVKNEVEDKIKIEGCSNAESKKDDNMESGKKQKKEKKRGLPDKSRSTDKMNKKSTDSKKMKDKSDGKKPLKELKCNSCEYVANFKSKLDRHLLKHTGQRPFGCSHCEKRFKWKKSLQNHMKNHVDDFLFHCSICLQGFDKKFDKLNHEANCKQLRYECYSCKNSFGTIKISLIRHMVVHTGEKLFKCIECSMQFSQLGNLMKHMKLHAGPRPFRCSNCYERFSQQDEKDQHEGKCNRRSYECYACGKSSGANKTHLNQHMFTHTGERPFKWQHCSKRFTRKCSHDLHMNVHVKNHITKPVKYNGRRGYECYLGKKAFDSHKGRLIQHMLEHSSMPK